MEKTTKTALRLVLLVSVIFTAWFAINFKLSANEHARQQQLGNLHATIYPTPREIKPFQARSDEGQAFTQQSLKGHWSLVFFGFTHCPYLCPTTMRTLDAVRDQMKLQSQPLPQIVFISIDPKRDSITSIHRYVRGFNPSFIGVRPSQQTLHELARSFQAIVDASDVDDNINHSATLFIVNPKAQLAGVFHTPHDPKVIASEMRLIQAKLTV